MMHMLLDQVTSYGILVDESNPISHYQIHQISCIILTILVYIGTCSSAYSNLIHWLAYNGH